MQLIHQIDSKLGQTIPGYSTVSNFTCDSCRASYNRIHNMYQYSTNKVKRMAKTSKQLRKDIIWIISQTTDDFLEYIQEKLEIVCSEADEKNRLKRVMNIYKTLKNKRLLTYVDQFIVFYKGFNKKCKQTGERYILPIYVRVKATFIVLSQMFMQMIANMFGKLKMSIKQSKDTITMYWSGELKQQKILKKIKQNFGEIKQFTVKFVQRGLEIKISKVELAKNYSQIMKSLSDILREVSQRSIEQWTHTKNRTVILYNSVLERIKEKEIQIRTQMNQKTPRSTQSIDSLLRHQGQPKIQAKLPTKPQNKSQNSRN